MSQLKVNNSRNSCFVFLLKHFQPAIYVAFVKVHSYLYIQPIRFQKLCLNVFFELRGLPFFFFHKQSTWNFDCFPWFLGFIIKFILHSCCLRVKLKFVMKYFYSTIKECNVKINCSSSNAGIEFQWKYSPDSYVCD